MHTLERLFVFLVVIFGMFILFLFGLYFDFGDQFKAVFALEEPATRGGEGARMMDRMYQMGRRRLEDLADLGSRGSGTNDQVQVTLSRDQENRLSGQDQVLDGKDKAFIIRAQLKARGYTRDEFLEMEALGADRTEYSRTLKEVRVMVGLDQRQEAISLLEGALGQVSPRNYLVRQDLMAYLVRLYYEEQDLEKAKERSTELYQLIDRIITVRKLALAQKDSPTIRSQIDQLTEEKNRLDVLHRYVKDRVEKTGTIGGMTDDERGVVLKTLDQALKNGKLSQVEYEQTVTNLHLRGGA